MTEVMEVWINGEKDFRQIDSICAFPVHYGRMPEFEPVTREGEEVVRTIDGKTFIIATE